MVAAIGCLTLCAPLIAFTITHHVTLPEPIQSGYDFKRDGSMVGSYGVMGLHDGHQLPLIIRRGKEVPVAPDESRRFSEVVATLPDGRFEVIGLDGKAVRAALVSGKLNLLGPMQRTPSQSEIKPVQSRSDPVINGLFPVPEGMRDTSGIESVDWYDYREGIKLCQVNTSSNMEYGYRSALREPGGRTRPLEQCIPGLAHYQVRGIDFVSPEGWFVVDAITPPDPPDMDGVRIGLGNELFWIEPRVRGSGGSR